MIQNGNKNLISFTGIQPSGNLTIGNYLGTMKYWKCLQDNFFCFFCIADLHSLTTSIFNKDKSFLFSTAVLDTLALYLSCGLDPNKSIIFLQSHVLEHTQLYWILNCFSKMGELSRMHQFKKFSIEKKNDLHAGLLSYPILMASDILLYQTNVVSVGEDQKQHLEFTKVLSTRFNNFFGSKIFSIPEAYIQKIGYKIMALQSPTKKMSKSDYNLKNSIFLLDDEKKIFDKIACSVTDSEVPSRIIYNKIKKPGISNLLSIFSGITNRTIQESENFFYNVNYRDFKKCVSDVLIKKLKRIQNFFYKIRKDEKYLKEILRNGALQASFYSKKTLSKVMNYIGFLK